VPIVVFVVQPGEVNTVDQRLLEHELWATHKVKAVRKTMAEIAAQGKLVGPDRRLVVDGVEVAVCYFRAGYQPEDYPTDAEWSARRLMERSFAIKCPSIAHHLAGAKKIQQALAQPGCLERFVDAKDAALLRESFAGLYGLDDESIQGDATTKAAYEEALKKPEGFVMKVRRAHTCTRAVHMLTPTHAHSHAAFVHHYVCICSPSAREGGTTTTRSS
jgi:glutathione synthase